METISLIKQPTYDKVEILETHCNMRIVAAVRFHITPEIYLEEDVSMEVGQSERYNAEGKSKTVVYFNDIDAFERNVYVNGVLISNEQNFKKSLADFGFSSFAEEVFGQRIPRKVRDEAYRDAVRNNKSTVKVFGKNMVFAEEVSEEYNLYKKPTNENKD